MTPIAASRSRMTMTAERVKALAPTRHDLVDAGFLGALTLLAMLTLENTFDNSLYLAAGALGLLLGMGVAPVPFTHLTVPTSDPVATPGGAVP